MTLSERVCRHRPKLVALPARANVYVRAAKALVGSDLKPINNVIILVERGRIKTICSAPDFKQSELVSHSYIEYNLPDDLCLIPSLIDAHLHLALDGTGLDRVQEQWKNEKILVRRVMGDLRKLACHGVSAVRDGGDLQAFNMIFKKRTSKSLLPLPQIVSCGEALRRRRGYGSFLGRGYTNLTSLGKQMEYLKLKGVDQFKVIVSGVVSFRHYGVVGGKIMPQAELQYLVGKARKLKMKVMAHASSDQAVQLALSAGVDSVEHGYYLSMESLKIMADRQIVWVPTIIPVAVWAAKSKTMINTPGINPALVNRIYREQQEKLPLALELGVPLGIGTDSGATGLPHGSALHEEIALYAEAGLPAKAIIRAVTETNARLLGLAGDAGLIKAGHRPFMLAVQGDPMADITCLSRIACHFVPGSCCQV